MMRGSMPTATLCPSAARSCWVSVPSTAVAAASSSAPTNMLDEWGRVIGIATETPTGVTPTEVSADAGSHVMAERAMAVVSPAV